MIVREALVADPRVLQADAPAREVAAVLAKPHVLNVLVADGDRLVGSVGEESIVAAVADGRDLRELTARDLADPDVPTVGPETPLDEALVLMGESGLERVAVVESGRLLGVLPREPVVRRLAEDEPPSPPPESGQQQV
jgi:CBS domain-containing protein